MSVPPALYLFLNLISVSSVMAIFDAMLLN